MRKLILCSLAAASLACAGYAAAVVGDSATGLGVHAEGINTVLTGKIPQVQVPAVQALFNGTTLDSARLSPATPRTSASLDASWGVGGDLLPADGGSAGSMLLAGLLVVLAVVIRRFS